MGNAVPEVSPVATNPDGEVLDLGAEISDMEVTDDVIGVRATDSLQFGTVEDFQGGSTTQVDIDPTCADLTANAGNFVLACGPEVLIFDSADPAEPVSWPMDTEATAAALTSTGELITGNTVDAEVRVHRRGEDAETIPVAETTDQIVAAQMEGEPDSVARINRANTIIQNVDWANDRQGGTLRVGVGVGQVAAGEAGLFIVSDTLGPQIAVYTSEDAVRLQQTAPVDASPWGVAWDPARKLAWTATTANNTATGYDISNGVPIAETEIATVADAHNIAVLSNGTFVAASATGDGLQIVPQEG